MSISVSALSLAFYDVCLHLTFPALTLIEVISIAAGAVVFLSIIALISKFVAAPILHVLA